MCLPQQHELSVDVLKLHAWWGLMWVGVLRVQWLHTGWIEVVDACLLHRAYRMCCPAGRCPHS
jgi:hypothetical protein